MSSISAGTTSTTTLIHSGDTTGSLVFKTNDTGSGGTTAVTIDTSQNVGIGTSSPNIGGANTSNAILSLIGKASTRNGILEMGNLATTGNDQTLGWTRYFDGSTENAAIEVARASSTSTAYMKFSTNGGSGDTERMRIDSSGNLLVGTTSGTQKLAVVQDHVSNNTASFRSTNASFAGDMIIFGADRNTTNNSFYPINYYNYGASAYKFRVADSGNVTNTNNSYGAISDIKLKENIVDATPKLAALQNVRIVNYNRIGSEEKELGVIAQELEQVFPALVETHIDRDREGNDLGTTTKSVKYSVFVPMLIKAIQEQQALITAQAETINALTARVVALESK